MEHQRIHGEHTISHFIDNPLARHCHPLALGRRSGLRADCCPERHIQRQQMLVGRMCALRLGRQGAVACQRAEVATRQRFVDGIEHPCAERLHIRQRLGPMLRARAGKHFMQVVREAAGADDQHAFTAQRCERPADLDLRGGRQAGIERQLQHRYIGIGKQVAQRHPRAMVERAIRVFCHVRSPLDGRCGQQRTHALRHDRGTRHVITQREQLRREAAEIVPRLLPGACGDGQRAVAPVRGNHQNGTWRRLAQARAKCIERRTSRARIERQHRRAVRNIERR